MSTLVLAEESTEWGSLAFVFVLGLVILVVAIILVRGWKQIPWNDRRANIVSAVLVGLLLLWDLFMIPVAV